MGQPMDVTQILADIDAGDAAAAEKLLPLVYNELRQLASRRLRDEKPGQTLQATALVHEAWLRLTAGQTNQEWNSRGHFFAAASESMRRILINRARDKKRLKRGGERVKRPLDELELALDTPSEQLLALDEALELLEAQDEAAAKLVELRFFAGLSHGQAAAALEMPRRTADRQWAYARAFLFAQLSETTN